MKFKKFIFCFLFFTNAIILAEEDNLDNKRFSISTVEEDSLINKNNWNIREWGNLYFLFPQVSIANMIKLEEGLSFYEKIDSNWGNFFNFLLSGVIEYKYMFHKKWGVNIRLILNNMENYGNNQNGFFSFDPSLEWIYKKKGKKIFSGSFCLVGFGFIQTKAGPLVNNFFKRCWTLGFVLLKYENDRRFYLNFGKIKTAWYFFLNYDKEKEDLNMSLLVNFFSIEFGLNIIGVNDWRKGRKIENIV